MVAKKYEVELSPNKVAFLRSVIDSGRYTSPDEVFDAALQIMEDIGEGYDEWRERARQKIARGLAQADAGLLVDGPAAIERIRQELHPRAAEDGITE